MAYDVYGDPDGHPLVYLHGTPGAACEAAFLAAAAKANGLCILALAREQVAGDSSEAYLRQLTAEVVQLVGERPLHLIGFSIGASLALRIAARLPTPAAGVWLVSAAAPLELPGSLDGMGAGRYTFALARQSPRLFAGLAAVLYPATLGLTYVDTLYRRNLVGTGANLLFVGFTIDGPGTKNLLFRAAGPSLGALGVPNTLVDPKLELFTTSTPAASSRAQSASSVRG